MLVLVQELKPMLRALGGRMVCAVDLAEDTFVVIVRCLVHTAVAHVQIIGAVLAVQELFERFPTSPIRDGW